MRALNRSADLPKWFLLQIILNSDKYRFFTGIFHAVSRRDLWPAIVHYLFHFRNAFRRPVFCPVQCPQNISIGLWAVRIYFRRRNYKEVRAIGLRLNLKIFEILICIEPLQTTRVQIFLLKFDESWITPSDQYKNHAFNVLNQSISVDVAPKIRQPDIRMSYFMDGSFQSLVFR